MGVNYASQHLQVEKEMLREKEIEREIRSSRKNDLILINPVEVDIKNQTTNNVKQEMERISTLENQQQGSEPQLGNMGDEKHQYKNILKTLYKNNLTSLTYEDMNAYFIQMNWKHYVISRNLKTKKGMIEVIYSSIESESNSSQQRFFDVLDIKEYPYRKYDLVKYKNLRQIVKKYGDYQNLPAIFLNDFYIGTVNDFNLLEENGYINQILTRGIVI